ncbi:MAG: DUF3540 domain-containing protein [Polyangiaceae bacterium]|nr:DUF3540 domain-containing protein [Polyangiaceae bacterium]
MIPAPQSGPAAAVATTFGELVAIADRSYRVRVASGESVEARRAVGCLVEPAVGDRVLVAGAAASAEWYVLSVLDREAAVPVVLAAEEDLTIASRAGSVHLLAAQDLDCAAGGAVRLAAPELHVEAAEATLGIRALEYLGDKVRVQAERVLTVARFLDTEAERWSQRVDRAFRFVKEMELLRAKQVDHAVEETLHLRARHALVYANQVVKIDGDQIQLG